MPREGLSVWRKSLQPSEHSLSTSFADSDSLVRGFLAIGTGVRRLEIIIEEHNAT